jgi:ABC-type glycerol-3-phosphate transport system permease component
VQSRSPAAYLGWTAAFGMVLFYALIPVLWLVSLSLKTPATVEDGRFIPKALTLDNYTALFQGGLDSPLLRPLINSVAIALIATVIVHGLRDRAPDLPGQVGDPRGGAGDRDVPADLGRRAAV